MEIKCPGVQLYRVGDCYSCPFFLKCLTKYITTHITETEFRDVIVRIERERDNYPTIEPKDYLLVGFKVSVPIYVIAINRDTNCKDKGTIRSRIIDRSKDPIIVKAYGKIDTRELDNSSTDYIAIYPYTLSSSTSEWSNAPITTTDTVPNGYNISTTVEPDVVYTAYNGSGNITGQYNSYSVYSVFDFTFNILFPFDMFKQIAEVYGSTIAVPKAVELLYDSHRKIIYQWSNGRII